MFLFNRCAATKVLKFRSAPWIYLVRPRHTFRKLYTFSLNPFPNVVFANSHSVKEKKTCSSLQRSTYAKSLKITIIWKTCGSNSERYSEKQTIQIQVFDLPLYHFWGRPEPWTPWLALDNSQLTFLFPVRCSPEFSVRQKSYWGLSLQNLLWFWITS